MKAPTTLFQCVSFIFTLTNTVTPKLILINRGHSSAKYPQTKHLLLLLFSYSSISFIPLIMAVFTFEDQTTSPVAPATLYQALVKDADNIVPKAVDSFKSVEIVEGNGGPGTIKKISFLEDGETKFVLHKIETIDEANLGYSYSIVGGAALPDTAEKITIDTKLSDGPNGGSMVKLSISYHSKGDAPPNEDELKAGKAKSDALFKVIEAYLLANA
ncbi:pathogenesis-related protein 2 [Vigna angularis]|uniref:pathogenesis-related protein 2 n=1 Tax=Phaseolus angularis TaxID=3914 RepID=UPI0022B4EEBC|nr:pathogenesis-related protein 2 [Vigna angularis]